MDERIQLTLFFTRGVSLNTWDEVGMLAREVALYQRLVEEGMGVRFVTYGGREETGLHAQLPEFDIRHNRWSLPEEWYAKLLRFTLPSGGQQIYKSNQMRGAEVGLAAARAKNAKFIARSGYLHSLNTERSHGVDSERAKAARALERSVYAEADRIVVTTPSMQATIMKRYDLDKRRIRVVPNYVQMDVFAPQDLPKSGKPKVVFVGRLSEEKNLDLLIEAMRGMDAQLLIVGDGYLRAEVRAWVGSSGADVRLMGSIPNHQLPALLNEADVFVLPSKYEGHPKALLEAMACGLAVVGARVSGIREIIRDGENGLLCEQDAESIRAAITRLLGDEALRTKLGQQARGDVARQFSLERVAALELTLLKELAAE